MEGETPRAPDVALQKYSMELLKCLDEMKYRRDTLHKSILRDMAEKDKMQNDLRKLTDKLVQVNENLCDKVIARNQLNEAVIETESAFSNMTEGSENLLRFIKKVTAGIQPLIKQPESVEIELDSKRKRASSKTDPTKR
ncbi:microtubule nucleation factor SSNA1-like [Dreissena polymorpha]|uniref:Uncharacterized protein n=1 Tax=Dreissena polymorpha TaxID=45954 RepID=A0A9D4BM93_DREPO|nr:microtubule nucleation factor SSNA1-like [Dreissena polymorpha]KAH3700066.1 hypothetical protein DPMN_075033 [Dreissena polymorpha]